MVQAADNSSEVPVGIQKPAPVCCNPKLLAVMAAVAAVFAALSVVVLTSHFFPHAMGAMSQVPLSGSVTALVVTTLVAGVLARLAYNNSQRAKAQKELTPKLAPSPEESEGRQRFEDGLDAIVSILAQDKANSQ